MAISQETAIALESLRLREGLWYTAEALLDGETGGFELSPDNSPELDQVIPTPFDLPSVSANLPQPAENDLEQLLAAMMEAEDEVQQQNGDLQTLNTIAEMLNRTLNLKEILQCAVDQTRAILQTDAAWIYLVNDSHQLELAAYTGLSTTYVRGMHHLQPGEGLEGCVAAENKARFVADVSADSQTHKFWVDKEKLEALAAVPITRPELKPRISPVTSHVVGVLAIGKRTRLARAWSPREMRLLSSIANQFALAIDNAQLYTQVQEDYTTLHAGNEVLREINQMLLEKNTSLESFIQEDLASALTAASLSLTHLANKNSTHLTAGQKQDIVTLQKIVNRLNDMTKEYLLL